MKITNKIVCANIIIKNIKIKKINTMLKETQNNKKQAATRGIEEEGQRKDSVSFLCFLYTKKNPGGRNIRQKNRRKNSKTCK